MKTIVIDPGHGGRDPGAVYRGCVEKDCALNIALDAADILGDRPDILSLVTHEGDIGRDFELDLWQRCHFANRHNADCFVSVHCNAIGPGVPAHGFETFSFPSSYAGSDLSISLFEAIHKGQHEILPRSAKTANFQVLRDTEMPAALVECGFVSSISDSAFLVDRGYQKKMGRAIAHGILDFLDLN